MTNNTATISRKTARIAREYGNALAFVTESFLEDNVEDYMDILLMDVESLQEFADDYNTTVEMILKANRDIRTVAEKTMID